MTLQNIKNKTNQEVIITKASYIYFNALQICIIRPEFLLSKYATFCNTKSHVGVTALSKTEQ